MALNGIKRLCIIAILPRNNEWYKEVSCHLNITKSFCSPFQPQKYGLDIPQCLFFMPGLHCHFPSITKLHCYKLFDRVRWPILFENFIEGLKPLSWLSWRALIIELIHSASSSIENLHTDYQITINKKERRQKKSTNVFACSNNTLKSVCHHSDLISSYPTISDSSYNTIKYKYIILRKLRLISHLKGETRMVRISFSFNIHFHHHLRFFNDNINVRCLGNLIKQEWCIFSYVNTSGWWGSRASSTSLKTSRALVALSMILQPKKCSTRNGGHNRQTISTFIP